MMRLTQVLGSDSLERSVAPRIVELVPDDDHAVAVLTEIGRASCRESVCVIV